MRVTPRSRTSASLSSASALPSIFSPPVKIEYTFAALFLLRVLHEVDVPQVARVPRGLLLLQLLRDALQVLLPRVEGPTTHLGTPGERCDAYGTVAHSRCSSTPYWLTVRPKSLKFRNRLHICPGPRVAQ